MKVLITVHDFFPSAMGGTEMAAYHVASELRSNGIGVRILFAEQAESPSVEHRTYEGLACTVLQKPIPKYHNLFAEEDPWVDEAFRNCLLGFQPDILHINHLLYLSTNIPKIAKQHNIPVVFTLQDYWVCCPRLFRLDSAERLCTEKTTRKCTLCCCELYSRYRIYPPRQGVYRPLDTVKSKTKVALSTLFESPSAYRKMRVRERRMRALIEYVDVWLVPSRFHEQAMSTWGLPKERLVYLRNGLSTKVLRRARSPRENGRLRFGTIGTFSRYKGGHVLLEAFRGLSRADLVLYGWPNPTFLSDYSDVVAQENVRVEGMFAEEDKPNIYAGLDAVIVPSIVFENDPLVVREALMAGVPVICSNIGGMKELVHHDHNGLHFRAGSPDDLRRVILSCVENPTRLRGMTPGSDNVLTVEDQVRLSLIPLYERLLASTRPGSKTFDANHESARPVSSGRFANI
jgi:glycosyltransferase involved in cell wall biosynthesis